MVMTESDLSARKRSTVNAQQNHSIGGHAIDENQMNILLKALRQRLKEDPAEKPVSTTKAVEITV